MPSAHSHPDVTSGYVDAEVREGRMIGPFRPGQIPDLHVNRMGVIPKGHIPGRWRLITDLSHPKGSSVNDGISPDLCSLRYTSVQRVARTAMLLGKGALMAKLDIKAAYRLVPVHPDDRPLLGIEWQGSHYVDGMLPFGLRSAPKVFTAVADALEWVIRQRGVTMVDHYLDDFVTLGRSASPECSQNLRTVLAVCEELGVPLAVDKLEGPADRLTFLGIEIDTQAGVLRLPPEKLVRLKAALVKWAAKKSCRRRQLESLIGTLQHASQVVRPGRSFLRQMIDLLRLPGATKGHHHIRLNRGFRADLRWWCTFAESWNISFKELFAGLLACAAWGVRWRGLLVQWRCDNQAAVCTVRSRTCRDQGMMHLIRCLFFFEARFGFELLATHLPGRENILADDLSRNRLSNFLSKAQSPEPAPSPLDPAIAELLLDEAGWTSPTWTTRFATTVAEA